MARTWAEVKMTMKNDCECYTFDNVVIDVKEWDNYTGKAEFNAVYTIQLGELMQEGLIDWDGDFLNWKEAAYDDEQYTRVCKYFEMRFYYREISMEPFKVWANFVRRKLVYEIMPKYKPLYARVAEGVNPLADSNEYYKNRTIESAYPETLLSENADYITDGRDEEYQRIKEGSYLESMTRYAAEFKGVDEMVLDELESIFISMYSANINTSW